MSASTPLFFHTRAAFPVLPAQLAAFSFVPEGDPKNLALELSLLCLLSSEGCRISRPRMPKRRTTAHSPKRKDKDQSLKIQKRIPQAIWSFLLFVLLKSLFSNQKKDCSQLLIVQIELSQWWPTEEPDDPSVTHL
ncbi:hypothetical protein Q3G72_004536 [Acer saccharum]|nr:hypothetical protein Q3G72_004536 [Acer saccharum]